MTQRMRIIGVADTDWFGPWLGRQQVMSRLAERHSVSYSRGPLNSWDRFSSEWLRAPLVANSADADGVRVDRRSSSLLRWPRFPRYDAWVVRRASRRMKNLRARAEGEETVSYLFHPSLVSFIEPLGSDLVVYHAYDDFESYPDWEPEHEEMQRALVRRADVVIALSNSVAKKLERVAEVPVHVVSSGVDYKAFAIDAPSASFEPEDLAKIGHPRIAYYGNLTLKVDFELIEELSMERPDWQFVIVGGLELSEVKLSDAVQRCQKRSNIHFLGHKSYEEMPRYMSRMDVNTIVYRTGAGLWSEACSPLKLYEYLAVGLPVVSCDIEVVRGLPGVVAIAQDRKGWVEALEQAIEEGGVGTPESRRAIASEHDWDRKVEEIESLLTRALAERPSPRR